MQPKLTILVAAVMLLDYCTAAPRAYNTDKLLRPSPINPEIPMEPKPAETITFITDPKEIAKFKREIAAEATTHHIHITAPTTIKPIHAHPIFQPERSNVEKEKLQHYRRKRSDISSKQITAPLNDNKQKDVLISSTPLTTSKRSRSSTTITATQAPAKSTTTAAAQIKHREKRDTPSNKDGSVPLIYRDQHKQPVSSLNHADGSQVPSEKSNVQPQTLPFFFNGAQTSVQPHTESKRDIPVPLVPKHHHPEVTLKADDKQNTATVDTKTNKPTEHSINTSAEKKSDKRTATENSDAVQIKDLSEQHSTQRIQHNQHHQQQQQTTSSTASSIFRHRPVPVAELFAKGKSAETPEKAQHEAN